MAKDFITLPRLTAVAKLGAAKSALYYYRPRGGIPVEREADIQRVAQTFANDPRMKLRVRLSDSAHTIVVVNTKKLQYGYLITF